MRRPGWLASVRLLNGLMFAAAAVVLLLSLLPGAASPSRLEFGVWLSAFMVSRMELHVAYRHNRWQDRYIQGLLAQNRRLELDRLRRLTESP